MIENTLQEILTELRNIHRTLCATGDQANPLQAPLPLDTQASVPPPPTIAFGQAAHSTAAAAQVPTAPGGLTAIFQAPPSVPAPPAATAAALATTVAPPTASPAGAVELDKSGLPWDGRIHASSKAKVADGSWRAKRGVDPELVKQVEAELRQTMAAPAAPGAGWVPPAAPANPLAAVPWPFPAPDAAPVVTYAELTALVTSSLSLGTVTLEQVNAACNNHGIPSFPSLASRPDLVPAVKEDLGL